MRLHHGFRYELLAYTSSHNLTYNTSNSIWLLLFQIRWVNWFRLCCVHKTSCTGNARNSILTKAYLQMPNWSFCPINHFMSRKFYQVVAPVVGGSPLTNEGSISPTSLIKPLYNIPEAIQALKWLMDEGIYSIKVRTRKTKKSDCQFTILSRKKFRVYYMEQQLQDQIEYPTEVTQFKEYKSIAPAFKLWDQVSGKIICSCSCTLLRQNKLELRWR